MFENNISHYNFAKYSKLYRWADYWHHVSEIVKLNPASLIEIGKGEGLVGYYLKERLGLEYKVVDMDPRLEPDVETPYHHFFILENATQ